MLPERNLVLCYLCPLCVFYYECFCSCNFDMSVTHVSYSLLWMLLSIGFFIECLVFCLFYCESCFCPSGCTLSLFMSIGLLQILFIPVRDKVIWTELNRKISLVILPCQDIKYLHLLTCQKKTVKAIEKCKMVYFYVF